MWGNNFSGSYCMDGNTYCRNTYGYGSAWNHLNKTCKCNTGYIFNKDIFGKLKCVDYNSYCNDKFGFNSTYNSLSDKCECRTGYEFTLKNNELTCDSCLNKYGTHSSYNIFGKKCECDSNYTLDNNGQCSKKQNIIYFNLKELDDSDSRAIVESKYNGGDYLLEYSLLVYQCLVI